VIPRGEGGTSRLENLRLTHGQCNHDRGGPSTPPPYGIGKHYRRRSQYRYQVYLDPSSDWETPAAECVPPGVSYYQRQPVRAIAYTSE
jgi:hypothetical protein